MIMNLFPKTLFANLIVLLLFVIACPASVTFTDSAGNVITLPESAERVVCLNSDVAEAMVVLGAGDKVVGLTDSVMSDSTLMKYLPNAVSVGDWQTPNLEKVLQLKPDAVIGYSSSKPKNSEQFTNAGINLIYLDCYKFDTLKYDMQTLGIMIGAEEAVSKYNSFLNKWQGVVSTRLENVTGVEPSVYIEGYTDYSAQGKNSGIDILMNIAKGTNLAADLGEQWPKVTPEWVISQDPDVIFKVVAIKSDKTLSEVRDAVIHRSGFEALSAVKNNQVFVLNGDLAYGPRSLAGLVYLAKALHPDQFRDVSPDDVLKEYAEEFVSGMENGEYYSPVL